MLEYRFDRNVSNGKLIYSKDEIDFKIKSAFEKIASGGELETSDNVIDVEDLRCFIYSLLIRFIFKDNKYQGYQIDCVIKPEDFAINEYDLFEETRNDCMTLLKMKTAKKAFKEYGGLL